MARTANTRKPVATQRSQTQSQSQSQTQSQSQGRSQRHSQSQRGRGGDDEDEDNDDDDEQENGIEADEREDSGDNIMERKANALVRLALFNEVKRLPLRREEINKKVLGNNTRSFNHVLQLANTKLQAIFGMELVELMSRNEREKELNAAADEGNATGLKKKAAASGSKSYILRSNLRPEHIELANITDNSLLDVELDHENDDSSESDDDEYAPAQPCGSIFNWSASDQLGALGVTYVLLSLVLLSGKVLGDLEMKKYLKSLRLEPNSHIKFTQHSPHKSMQVDAFLNQLVRQGYLDKVKVNATGGGSGSNMPRATQGNKRSRPSAATADTDENVSYEWRWGSRAQSEIGEAAIGQFVGQFMVERVIKERSMAEADEDEDGDEDVDGDGNGNGSRRRGRGARGGRRGRGAANPEEEKERMLEVMMKGIGRAVGGKLSDVK